MAGDCDKTSHSTMETDRAARLRVIFQANIAFLGAVGTLGAMSRKTLTIGLLVSLLALSSLGLLEWVHLQDARHHDEAPHQAGDCATCQALSTARHAKAVVEAPLFLPLPDQAARSVSIASLIHSHTNIASHHVRGPPLCA